MANGVYKKGISKFYAGTLAWSGALWKTVLVDATYTPNLDTHEFLSDIDAGKRVATSAAMTGLVVLDDAVLDADPATFSAFTGADAPYLVVYKDTAGADTVKELFLIFDTLDGLPVSPASVPVTVNWADDADRIFHG